MKLWQKCIVFLAVVLTIQASLFLAINWIRSKSQQEAANANYSTRIVTHAIQSAGLLYEAIDALLIWALSRSEEAEKRYKRTVSEAPRQILDEMKTLDLANPEDAEQIRDLDLKVTMCLENLESVFKLANESSEITRIGTFLSFFKNEIQPQIQDIWVLHGKILDRHMETAQSSLAKESERTNVDSKTLVAMFAGNLSVVLVMVTLFFTNVVGRLRVVTDNISRFNEGEELNEMVTGKDEIFGLDASFHAMAKSLTEAREKERAIMDNLPVGIFVCDKDGVIESVTPRFQVLLLRSPAEIVGKNISEIIPNQDFSLETLTSSNLPRVWRVSTANGDFPAELSLSRFHHSDDLKYLIGVMDVTAREQVDQLKQEFVSVVSHDLRTPLTSIQISAELVSHEPEENLTPRSRRAVENIQQDCQRLLRLTKDLLDISKLESGNIQLDLEPHELSSIFEQSLNAVEPAATRSGIQLSAKTIDLSLACDKDRIVQVLVNLLSNAIKFSEEGKVVSLNAIKNGDEVSISVVDQGRGIKKEDQKLIFERFKQTKRSDSERGTGLGLAICKMLAEAHGGTIEVDSEPGAGSTFYLKLPISKS